MAQQPANPPRPDRKAVLDPVEPTFQFVPLHGRFGLIYEMVFTSAEAIALGPRAFRVFTVMHLYLAPNDRGAWPKQATLALATGLSRQSVNKAIAELIRVGLLTRVHRGKLCVYYAVIPPTLRVPSSTV